MCVCSLFVRPDNPALPAAHRRSLAPIPTSTLFIFIRFIVHSVFIIMYFALLPVGGSLLFSTLLYIFAFVFVCSVRQFGSRSQSRCCPSSCPLPLHPDPCSDGVDNDVVGDDGPAGGTESPGGACHPH